MAQLINYGLQFLLVAILGLGSHLVVLVTYGFSPFQFSLVISTSFTFGWYCLLSFLESHSETSILLFLTLVTVVNVPRLSLTGFHVRFL